jgi:uncharacterized protein (UPF0210 family)
MQAAKMDIQTVYLKFLLDIMEMVEAINLDLKAISMEIMEKDRLD